MKLVIDISEEVYAKLNNVNWESVPKESFDEMAAYEYAIANGKTFEDELKATEMYVVMVKSENTSTVPVAVCSSYRNAFNEAIRWIDSRMNNPCFEFEMLTDFDYDIGVAQFKTKNCKNGVIEISKVWSIDKG